MQVRSLCGLRIENLLMRLFPEKDLTFSEAYDIAIQVESTIQQQQKAKALSTSTWRVWLGS